MSAPPGSTSSGGHWPTPQSPGKPFLGSVALNYMFPPRKTGPIHGSMEEKLVLQGNVDREDFVVQVWLDFA